MSEDTTLSPIAAARAERAERPAGPAKVHALDTDALNAEVHALLGKSGDAPDYTASVDTAWPLVDEMGRRGRTLRTFKQNPHSRKWIAKFDGFENETDTRPGAALCRAFVHAMRKAK